LPTDRAAGTMTGNAGFRNTLPNLVDPDLVRCVRTDSPACSHRPMVFLGRGAAALSSVRRRPSPDTTGSTRRRLHPEKEGPE